MAEWFKAAVLKTVVRKYRGFESYSLRQGRYGEMTELADGARLLSECGDNTPPRVRIPLSPPRIPILVEHLNQDFLLAVGTHTLCIFSDGINRAGGWTVSTVGISNSTLN